MSGREADSSLHRVKCSKVASSQPASLSSASLRLAWPVPVHEGFTPVLKQCTFRYANETEMRSALCFVESNVGSLYLFYVYSSEAKHEVSFVNFAQKFK